VQELGDALSLHMAVEEQFLYPIVLQRLGDEEAREAENEHMLTREGLQNLRDLVDEPGFAAAVESLEAGVNHHVADEEEKVFPGLREKAADEIAALDPDELEQQVDRSAMAETTTTSSGTTSSGTTSSGTTSSGASGSGGSPSPDDLVDLTKDELYQKAKEMDIPGRSNMTKKELAQAVAGAS
jgi:hypothetical protein